MDAHDDRDAAFATELEAVGPHGNDDGEKAPAVVVVHRALDIKERISGAAELVMEARRLNAGNDFSGAIGHASEAIAVAPTSWEAFLERSRAHSNLFRRDCTALDSRDAAIKDARRAAFMRPQSWRCVLQRSRAVGAGGDLEEALADVALARELAEADLDGETRLETLFSVEDQQGRLELEVGKKAKLQDHEVEAKWTALLLAAVRTIDKALKLKPRAADTLNNRGVAYYELRRFPQAMDDFERCIAIDPGHDRALSNKALVLRVRRDLEAAHASLSRSIEENPNSAISFNNLACIERDLGRNGNALRNFQRAVDMDADYKQAMRNRDSTLRELKEPVPITPATDVAMPGAPTTADAPRQ